jgi:hypothetical protein
MAYAVTASYPQTHPGAGRAIYSPQRYALLRGPAEPDLAIYSPQRYALLRGPAEPDLAIG